MANPFSKEPNPFADPAVTAHSEMDGQGDYGGVPPVPGSAWGQQGGAWASGPASPPAANYTRNRPMSPQEKARSTQHREATGGEARIDQRNIQQREAVVLVAKNWPVCWPILYHDIDAEIPIGFRDSVKKAYWCFLLFIITVIFNFLGVTLSLFKDNDIIGWLFAGCYVVLGIPGAWLIWYKRLYNSAKFDRSFTFLCFSMGYMAHLIFCICGALAVPLGLGAKSSTGLLRMLAMFKEGMWLGVIFMLGFIGWLLCCIATAYIFQQVIRDFRGRGGPAALRTQTEAAVGRAALNAAVNHGGRV